MQNQKPQPKRQHGPLFWVYMTLATQALVIQGYNLALNTGHELRTQQSAYAYIPNQRTQAQEDVLAVYSPEEVASLRIAQDGLSKSPSVWAALDNQQKHRR